MSMRSYLEKFSKLCRNWNSRPLGEDDFYGICRREKITVVEMPLVTNGFYYCVKKRHFIAIDSRLSRYKKLFVMFHELGHFLMHSPDTNTTANFHGIGKRNRKEIEADIFALCALIPRVRLESETLTELIDEGIPEDMLRLRLEIYERRRI